MTLMRETAANVAVAQSLHDDEAHPLHCRNIRRLADVLNIDEIKNLDKRDEYLDRNENREFRPAGQGSSNGSLIRRSGANIRLSDAPR
jgi:hypothetical protein